MRALRSGARRLLGQHGGPWGRRYDDHYRALRTRYGDFTDPLARAYASAVAAAWVGYWRAQEALAQAQQQREQGKGRRPSAALVRQLQKRRGLEWDDYNKALAKLEELVAKHGHGRDLASVVTRAHEARGR